MARRPDRRRGVDGRGYAQLTLPARQRCVQTHDAPRQIERPRQSGHGGARRAGAGAPRAGWLGRRGAGVDAGKAVAHLVADSAAARAGVALLARLRLPPRVEITRRDIVVPRLPALDGLRVLHPSDLHLRPGPALAWQIPALVTDVPYDLACYTGDFIDSDEDLSRLATLLGRLPRPAGARAYAVPGNHDHTPYGRGRGANDVRRRRRVLAAAGVAVLTNGARPLYGGRLYIASVDDPATDRDDLGRALAGVPADACCVLLAHSSDIVLRPVLRVDTRRPGLILAGHTRGGQIRLPVVGALLTESRVLRRLAMGLHTVRGVPLVVSRGVGYSGLDIRIGSPPEVVLLTLRSPTRALTAAGCADMIGRGASAAGRPLVATPCGRYRGVWGRRQGPEQTRQPAAMRHGQVTPTTPDDTDGHASPRSARRDRDG